ncbi:MULTISPECIES: YceH family protein [Pseudoalteromonas]|uniref:YceH family protein n=1 Tax=Pseudoalteromonas TaxID=53246 RepID=UPI0004903F1D|nr:MULTISPECIES: YceH family protein [Pseudoalteromonas]MDN3396195.1 YceH family protein [Pseudoalteromonas sp. APC 3215]MDN3402816.1 YceH family protein [Pseudoalteromonas sp. APC 3213]MDN3406728.1 YceH family protein [Pseudoalteromonas sp. APC 3218]MDN3410034.1 YceH family protein [Pseudoalteromonas sp. APC 3894]MDN3417227.1 YceH family protein [Pseudoalteromonas sp. APC 3227]
MQLSMEQQRVIGCLLEKQSTTPEHYPLSLNALTNACNQKSNRAPVVNYTEEQVQTTVDELISMRLVTVNEGLSGRVNKYDHRFCNTEFSHLQFDQQQRAIICLLLLRGAQTPGELKTRSSRLADFARIDDVEKSLEQLIQSNHVKKLPRESGKRDCRYIHLFADQSSVNEASLEAQTHTDDIKNTELNDLLAEIDELKVQLKQIKAHLGL